MITAIKFNVINQAGIKGKTAEIISGERKVSEFISILKDSKYWGGEIELKTYPDFGIQVCDFS
jgi:hypothetical protein